MSAPRLPETLPLQTRLAPLGTVNVEARTIECTWTTGATVRRRRYTWDGPSVPFDEELVVSEEAIDLSRLRAGAPVLDSHATYSIEAQRAVVDDAWIVNGEGIARMQFPEAGIDEASDRLFALATPREGRKAIIRNISVGYAIDRVRVIQPEKSGEVERRIIERWTPFELSFVTVPADAGAQVRARDVRAFPVEIIGRAASSGHHAARARMGLRARSLGLAG